MNTRDPIQRSHQPPVLSLTFSASRQRFSAGLGDELRTFRTDNCLTTTSSEQLLPSGCGASVAATLDDRFNALVSNRKSKNEAGPNTVTFWDAILRQPLAQFDFHEPVLNIKLTSRWMVVILSERAIVFQFQEVQSLESTKSTRAGAGAEYENAVEDDRPRTAPNAIYALYHTSRNPFAVACLANDLLVLPAATTGQVQLISLDPLRPGNKRVLPAHKTSLRFMALSDDSSLLATTSEQGTLVRVWNTRTHDSLFELRRGVDAAAIYGLAFSPQKRWLACTSDKGTLHVFDLRPSTVNSAATDNRESKGRRRTSSYVAHRLSGNSYEKDSASGISAERSSPSRAPSTAVGSGAVTGYQGSVQEYYGLRPPPTMISAPTGQSQGAMAALRASPLAPKILSDTRSIASIPFYMGDDPPHWQGGPAHSWTVTPNGTKKRVANPVLPLPNDPSGRPPKGILAFAPSSQHSNDDEGAILYIIGGGSDARWEMFDLVPAFSEGVVNGWALRNRGFRRYLSRQFVD